MIEQAVIYAMVAVLPLALLWYAVIGAWQRSRRDRRAQVFSLCSGLAALLLSLVLQYQLSIGARVPGPAPALHTQCWLLSLALFTCGMPAAWASLWLLGEEIGGARVPICVRCGNRAHLHTRLCVRCGDRLPQRRPGE